MPNVELDNSTGGKWPSVARCESIFEADRYRAVRSAKSRSSSAATRAVM
jgi:hypothetical protein